MEIIIGLGNPENEYKGTRHNIGFESINKLAYDHKINVDKKKFKALIGEGTIANKKVILVKPQTYMNLSGESVHAILDFYKLAPQNIIVLYDDVDLEPSHIRIRENGSAGGHNGIKNIIAQLQTDAFLRVRIGIGEKPKSWVLADYVLSKFYPEEMENVVLGITKACEAVETILKDGSVTAMNRFNKKISNAKDNSSSK